MDLLEKVEIPDFVQSSICVYCKNPYSLVRMCQNFHLICSECQNAFLQNCPVCFGAYLPHNSTNDLLTDALLGPINYDKPSNSWVLDPNIAINKKKKAVEKCKESFFLGVWDATISSLFSSRTTSVRDSLSKIISKITKRLGKPILDLIASNKTSNDKPNILPIATFLLLLLISSKFLFQKGASPLRIVKPKIK